MEEIKVGNFIRTKDGVIAKVTYVDAMMVDCDRDVFDLNNLAMMEIPTEYIEEYIVKHSPKIIDLIEKGDYVNGEQVLCFRKYDCNYDIGTEYSQEFDCYFGYNKEDIESIVTKEQYNQMKYIVGE